MQETWFVPSISNQELIANIAYNVFRRDRFNFKSNASSGGGVAVYIREGFTATEIMLAANTTTEMIAIHIETDGVSFVLLNVYIPPPQNNINCAIEIGHAVAKIYRLHPSVRILACGDFNAPGLRWTYDDEQEVYLSNNNQRLNIYEQEIVSTFASCGLFQINQHPNNRGIFLDLVLSNDYTNINVQIADESMSIDRHSFHHKAYVIELVYLYQSQHSDKFFYKK